MVSLILLSKLINRKFLIRWDKEDIRGIIDYSDYDYYNYIARDTDEPTWHMVYFFESHDQPDSCVDIINNKKCSLERFNSLDGPPIQKELMY